MPKWFVRGVIVTVAATVAADFILDRLRPEPREPGLSARARRLLALRGAGLGRPAAAGTRG